MRIFGAVSWQFRIVEKNLWFAVRKRVIREKLLPASICDIAAPREPDLDMPIGVAIICSSVSMKEIRGIKTA